LEILGINENQIKGQEIPAEECGNVSLKILDLSAHPIGSQDDLIIKQIKKQFQIINGHESQIGDQGAVGIAKVLKGNDSLKVLNLSFNQIGNVGVIALARALEDNHILQILDLRRNQIGSQGLEAFRKALNGNISMKILGIDESQIKDQEIPVDESGNVSLEKILDLI